MDGIKGESAALLGFLAAVEPGAWDRPSSCAGWSVKDVLSHLTGFEVRAGRLYRGETDGSDIPASPAETEEGMRLWNPLPGEALRAAYWQHAMASQRVAERLTDEEWRRPVRAAPATELRHFARIHFFETAVHGHDISAALGAPPLWAERAPMLVEFCATAGAWALRARGVPPEGSLAVEVEGAGRWTIAGGPDGWALAPDADVDATVWTDPETFVLATTGRLPIPDALARSKFEGDEAVARRILAGWRLV